MKDTINFINNQHFLLEQLQLWKLYIIHFGFKDYKLRNSPVGSSFSQQETLNKQSHVLLSTLADFMCCPKCRVQYNNLLERSFMENTAVLILQKYPQFELCFKKAYKSYIYL